MSKVEGVGGPIDPLPPQKVSCNYFFFEASRVNDLFMRSLRVDWTIAIVYCMVHRRI